ncbi:MAG: hypothetical protein M5U26_13975 [Planctomycetota bacterium]|nr:hypothetical protein [Planctomycetota bacterium]
MADTPPNPAPEPSGRSAPSYREGPKISRDRLDQLSGLEAHVAEGATWRGWFLGLLGLLGLSFFVPYCDFVMQSAWFSFNSFPMISVVYLLALILAINACALLLKAKLGLTRADLTLIFVMTAVVYAIPGVGFWAFWSTGVTAGNFHASAENNWATLVHPYLTPGLFPIDPTDPNDPAPRPVEWFYTGLPPGKTIPWAAWVQPYLLWLIVVICMYGIWFSVSALLHRRWSEQERLPFPMAQVPEAMLAGTEDPSGQAKGFLSHPLARWGIILTFLLHSFNALNSYIPNVPEIRLMNWNMHAKYLTELPWSAMGPLHIHWYPSIVGLTYLLSLEVAFSLWIFYILQKVLNMTFSTTYGLSSMNESYHAQGAGGLLMLVVLGFGAARTELSLTFRQALGLAPYERRPGEVHPRYLWGVFVLGFLGAVIWLSCVGVSWYWAAAIVCLFILVMTGLSRLIAEAGVFSMQFANFPIKMLSAAVPPTVLGGKNVVMLTVWDRMFSADWYRLVPMPHIMNCLHLSRGAGLRMTHALGGMILGVGVMLIVSFGSFLNLAYTQGGVNGFGWFFNPYPSDEYGRIAKTMSKVKSFEKKEAEAAEKGKEIPYADRPDEARRDWKMVGWMGVGGAVLAAFTVARRFFFWWPHPAGYVLWMAGTIDRLWFAFFLGWLLKWMVSKFGGMKVYNESRNFFIGMVVGEAVAAVVWSLVAIYLEHRFGYRISMG